MYRIYFDPNIGRFIIQVSAYGFFWVNVKRKGAPGESFSVANFETFENANEHVASIGLDKLYVNKSADQYRKYMASVQHA